jgi:hypothetical protein
VSEGSDREDRGPRRRLPLRVWLVTGPPGRLLGFWLDFAAALRQARKQSRQG